MTKSATQSADGHGQNRSAQSRESQGVTGSRGRLVLLLVSLVVLYAVLATLFALHAVGLVEQKGLQVDLTDVYLFACFYVLLAYFLTALPLFMVVGYHGVAGNILQRKVKRKLTTLGLEVTQLRTIMDEYQGRNGLHAFLLPMLVNMVLVFLMWNAALFPYGVAGMFDGLDGSGEVRISIAILVPVVVMHASVVTWAFLGAYFYSIIVMIRRWMQMDLTVGSVWRIDVRLAVAFILGMLIMHTFSGPEEKHLVAQPALAALAFVSGIVPNTFLRWINRQAKRLLAVEDRGGEPFGASDLRGKIEGLSFWQLDRLAEEGIESVQDLAMKEIPSLFIRTRFDTPLLMFWVDRALLCVYAGENFELFRRAGIGRATDLVFHREQGRLDAVMQSLDDARQFWDAGRPAPAGGVEPIIPPKVTRAMLDNMLISLESGHNLRYLYDYRRRFGLESADAGE